MILYISCDKMKSKNDSSGSGGIHRVAHTENRLDASCHGGLDLWPPADSVPADSDQVERKTPNSLFLE